MMYKIPIQRMKILILSIFVNFCFISNQNIEDEIYLGIEKFQEYYDLPKLPFSFDSMEPWIDARTMEVHYSGHHASYMAKMNAALQEWRLSGENKELANSAILNIIRNIEQVPQKWRTAIRNNGGGYVNHIFYFATMSPNPNGIDQTISPKLLNVFRRSFHNFTHFKTWMSNDASKLFGSGYVWLCREPKNNFFTVYSTSDQISPLTYGLQPVLVIDIWEHAYYLKNQNRRKEYIESWWNVVDLVKVERLFNWWASLDAKHDEL